MGDVSHTWNADLSINAKGDLAFVARETAGQQRVLRRLLTNRGDYLWHADYGAGLGSFVGQPTASSQVAAIVRAQIFLERSVSRSPEPRITADIADSTGAVFVQVQYADTELGDLQTLSFTLENKSL